MRVVVAVGDEPGHVEQLLVELPGADVGQDGVGVHVRRTVDDGAVETRSGAVRGLEGPNDGAVGAGTDDDLVTGEQGDGVYVAAG
ncbi:hypothetical protein [Streptomyces sp. NPDC004533]|uniref:hypothetical protein n=1 Tax=Streptomyces sp. NPDC004533 TaxID=3154278 RepID=UPI0033A6BD96